MIVLEPRLHPVVVLVGAMVLSALIVWLVPRQHRMWAGVLLVPTFVLNLPESRLAEVGSAVAEHMGLEEQEPLRWALSR